MGNFTPGPWTVAGPRNPNGRGPEHYTSVIVDHDDLGCLVEQDEEICEIPDWENLREQQNANALLISAAPDMYEALQLANAFMKHVEELTGEELDVKKCINKALAKAEGSGE